MKEQESLGFPTHGERLFQCGFLLYYLQHPDCKNIQNTWMKHIQKCGIQDQISMYYVAQRFPDSIGEFVHNIQK